MGSASLEAAIAGAWDDILAQISEGEIVRVACASHGLSRGAVAHWRRQDQARIKQWTDARAASAANLEEQAIEAASNPDVDPQRARVIVDTLKWAAAKRNPDHYSDRSRVDVTHKVIDYAAILARAEARLAERIKPAVDVVDVAFVETEKRAIDAKLLM